MTVTVTEKEVKITDLNQVNAGEYRVSQCEFVLPQCFDGLSVMAVFNGIPVPLVNAKCYIPPMDSGDCVLGVYGYKKTGEELELIYSPKPTVFYVEKGSYSENKVELKIPELFDFEEYCSMLRDYWQEIIESNTLGEYTKTATEKQYYSAKVLNDMYLKLQGDLDELSSLVGGAE
ncbi:MAG: hypothetical protein ACI4VW_09610 [Acutalibacteraceae bacterium]